MSTISHLHQTDRYHASILERPIKVQKAIQILLNSHEGVLGVEQLRGDLPFNSGKIIFNSLESGEQFLVKTSLLEKEMRKFNLGNFDYQTLLAGREVKEGKYVLPKQIREAFKTELVKRFMSLKSEGILFKVPIQSFNLSFLRKITQRSTEQAPLFQRTPEVSASAPKDMSEQKTQPLFNQGEINYQAHVLEKDLKLIEALRANLENDYETDLSEQDIDLVIIKFSEIQEKKKSISIESDIRQCIEEKKQELRSSEKACLVEALEFVLQRAKEKY